jgi:hypothetical protein
VRAAKELALMQRRKQVGDLIVQHVPQSEIAKFLG